MSAEVCPSGRLLETGLSVGENARRRMDVQLADSFQLYKGTGILVSLLLVVTF